MGAWILSIVGVIFLGVMVDIIIPSGKTNVIIKSVFALVFMCVVISPIINLVLSGKQIDFTNMFQLESEYDEQLINETKLKIKNHLEDYGVSGVDIEIKGYSTNNDLYIQQINVDLSNLVLNKKDEHINKYELITELIMSVVDVNKEKIIYG